MELTVVIPVHNTPPDILQESIASIVNQDYQYPFRFIIWNDGSDNKDTIDLLEYLKNRYEVISNEKNHGLSYTLNRALETCLTEFMVRMDSDDISHPSRISKQVQYLRNHPETDVLGTNLVAFNSNDNNRTPIFRTNKQERPEPVHNKNSYWIVNHATCIYRVQSVLKAGGYNEDLRRGQDIDLWRRMYDNGAVFRNVIECLYSWRRL